jgi:hypothetical protein
MGGCVSDCPMDRGFEFQTTSSGLRCAYTKDPRVFVNLNLVEALQTGTNRIPNLRVEDIEKIDPSLYSKYNSERTRVSEELAIVFEKLDKGKKLEDAFARLQDAENARDQAPDAYRQARSNYYTLKDGDTWIQREKQRVLKAEVEPVANQMLESKRKLVQQYENQRKTVDVVNGLKDNVLSLKDEMKYAADTFQDQLNNVKDAINRERRGRVKETDVSIWDWLDTLFNVAIIGCLLYVIYILYKKFSAYPPTQPAAVIIRG